MKYLTMRTGLLFLSLLTATCATAASAATVNYSYDDAGRLTSAAYPNGTVISYNYDKAGNLLSRVVSAGGTPSITGVVNGASFQPGIAEIGRASCRERV